METLKAAYAHQLVQDGGHLAPFLSIPGAVDGTQRPAFARELVADFTFGRAGNVASASIETRDAAVDAFAVFPIADGFRWENEAVAAAIDATVGAPISILAGRANSNC